MKYCKKTKTTVARNLKKKKKKNSKLSMQKIKNEIWFTAAETVKIQKQWLKHIFSHLKNVLGLIRKRRDLQFNIDSELSEFLPEICWEEIAEEIFFF